jgi:hypothetical protein
MRRRNTHAQALKRRREDYHRRKSHADEGLALSPNCHRNVVPGRRSGSASLAEESRASASAHGESQSLERTDLSISV